MDMCLSSIAFPAHAEEVEISTPSTNVGKTYPLDKNRIL